MIPPPQRITPSFFHLLVLHNLGGLETRLTKSLGKSKNRYRETWSRDQSGRWSSRLVMWPGRTMIVQAGHVTRSDDHRPDWSRGQMSEIRWKQTVKQQNQGNMTISGRPMKLRTQILNTRACSYGMLANVTKIITKWSAVSEIRWKRTAKPMLAGRQLLWLQYCIFTNWRTPMFSG